MPTEERRAVKRVIKGKRCDGWKAENPRRPGQMSGPRALQITGTRTVRPRRIRQRARSRRRFRARGPRRQGLARPEQLPGDRDRSDRGIADREIDLIHLDLNEPSRGIAPMSDSASIMPEH